MGLLFLFLIFLADARVGFVEYGDVGEGGTFPDDEFAIFDRFIDQNAIDHTAIELGEEEPSLADVCDGGQAFAGVVFEGEEDAVAAIVGGEGCEGKDVFLGYFRDAGEGAHFTACGLLENHARVVGGVGF